MSPFPIRSVLAVTMPSSSSKGMSRSAPATSKLEKILGVKFKNTALLQEALTHKSYAMEQGGRIPFNERLEFLGDSILSAVVAHYLFNKYPDVDEGRLSQLKSMLVSRPSLTVWGKEIGLGQFLRLSEGEHLAGGRDRNSIVGNAMEAVLGAMYLEAGFEPAQKFIEKLLSKRKRLVFADFKNRAQECAHEKCQNPTDIRLIHRY